MIHVLHPVCVKLLKVVLGRLVKSNVYIDENGQALKQTDLKKIELHLKNDQFRTLRGKQSATMYFMHLLILNISCLNSL